MGTRSVIAKPWGDVWRGRYCHWDGYPQWTGHNIFNIVKREGVETARKVLVDDNFYWSSIDYYAHELGVHTGDSRFYLVEGYGVAGNEEQSSPDEWYSPMEFDSWLQYIYVIADDGLMVLSDPNTLFGFYPWDLPEPNWLEEMEAFADNEDEMV